MVGAKTIWWTAGNKTRRNTRHLETITTGRTYWKPLSHDGAITSPFDSPFEAMKYTIKNGSTHFYICAVDGGYLAKSIGDSEDALRVTKGLVAKLNQFEKMKEALEAIDAYWEAGDFSRDRILWSQVRSALKTPNAEGATHDS